MAAMSDLTTSSTPARLLAFPLRHGFHDLSRSSLVFNKPPSRAPRLICMAEPYLITKLDSAEKTWKELSVTLADPDVVSNPSEYQKLAQSVAELDEVVTIYKNYKDCEKQLQETKALAKDAGNDEDMAEMISYEIESLSNQIKELEGKLKAQDGLLIVSWNGLAISAFARASKILKNEPEGIKFNFPVVGLDPKEYIQVADRTASFIRRHLYNERTHQLQHSFRNGPSKAPGFLDDYAFLISGLLDLYEFGGQTNWLVWATELQDTQDELFLDREGGGYFNTPGEDPNILLRVNEDHDGAEPSGNSVAVINLVRLASMVAGNRSVHYRGDAEHVLAVFETRLKDMAMAVPLMCCAADMLTVPSRKQVVLVGHKHSVEFENMLAAAHASYDINKTVIHIDPTNSEEMQFWEGNNSNITLMAKNHFAAEKVVALVCQNFTCSAAVNDPGSPMALLSQKSSSSA